MHPAKKELLWYVPFEVLAWFFLLATEIIHVSEQYLHCKAGIANGNWTHLAFFNDFQLFKRK